MLAVHAHRLPVDLPHEVHRPSRPLVERQPKLVRRDRPLHRLSHLALDAEEAVRRHEPVERLVRPLVVVVRDKVADALARLDKVLWMDPVPQLAL